MLPKMSIITAGPTGASNTGVPPRPRQFDESQPDYETPEEYEALGLTGGENVANNQIQANFEAQGGFGNEDNEDSSYEGKNRKLQGGANRARLAANLSRGQSASTLLTG